MKSIETLSALLEVGRRAVEAEGCRSAWKAAKGLQADRYRDWKADEGIEFVIKHSPEWERMMVDTKPEHEAVKVARRALYNAERRLATAIRRGGGAAR